MKSHLTEIEKIFNDSSTYYEKKECNEFTQLVLFYSHGYPSHTLKFKKDGALIPTNIQTTNGEEFFDTTPF